MIHNRLKFTSMLLAPRGWRVRSLDCRLSQPGLDPSSGKLICLATLMSSDRTKQICLWMTIYIKYPQLNILFDWQTLAGPATLGQSWLGTNNNEQSTNSRTTLQFSIIHRILVLFDSVIRTQKGSSTLGQSRHWSNGQWRGTLHSWNSEASLSAAV